MEKTSLSTFGWIIVIVLIITTLLLYLPSFSNVVDDSSITLLEGFEEKADMSNKKHIISINNTIYGEIKMSCEETLKNGVTVYSAKAGESINFEVTPIKDYEFVEIQIKYTEKDADSDNSPIYVSKSQTIKADEGYSFVMPDSKVEINPVFKYIG